MNLRVALIGCGGLGGALARGLGWRPELDLTLADLNAEKAHALIDGASRARVAPSAEEAARDADIVVLAVKPHQMVAVMSAIGKTVGADALLVSCAAGLPLAAMEKARGKAALARAMPNVGASVGACTTAAVLGAGCEEQRDIDRLEAVFGVVGEMRVVRDEQNLHPITALSGSGPAFALLALEAMEDAGVAAGLSREDARFFARGAFSAAAALGQDTEVPPAAIRARITSPGGTTIAGLLKLEETGARAAFIAAVQAATRRSKEME